LAKKVNILQLGLGPVPNHTQGHLTDKKKARLKAKYKNIDHSSPQNKIVIIYILLCLSKPDFVPFVEHNEDILKNVFLFPSSSKSQWGPMLFVPIELQHIVCVLHRGKSKWFGTA